jgi:hypothetical protein
MLGIVSPTAMARTKQQQHNTAAAIPTIKSVLLDLGWLASILAPFENEHSWIE